MDDLLKDLFNYIPEKWRPWVALGIIIYLVITKTQSTLKTLKLEQQAKLIRQHVPSMLLPRNIIIVGSDTLWFKLKQVLRYIF